MRVYIGISCKHEIYYFLWSCYVQYCINSMVMDWLHKSIDWTRLIQTIDLSSFVPSLVSYTFSRLHQSIHWTRLNYPNDRPIKSCILNVFTTSQVNWLNTIRPGDVPIKSCYILYLYVYDSLNHRGRKSNQNTSQHINATITNHCMSINIEL